MLTHFTKPRITAIGAYTLFSLLFLSACSDESSNTANTREKTVKNVSDTITSTMNSEKTPGMSVALIYEDKVVFSEGFGVTDIETQKAVTANTSFWLGSVSKTAVAVSLMHAIENGLLTLDDNINDVLNNQGEVNLTTPFESPISLQQLVTHTSSIIDSIPYICAYYVQVSPGEHYNLANQLLGASCDESLPVGLASYLNAYLSSDGAYYSAEQNFLSVSPGTTYQYSNIGTALAGFVLEAKTGTSLATYARTNIFDPLEMFNTSWLLSDLDSSNIAIPYVWDADNQEMTALPIYSLSTWPDGGLRSSAADLAKYLIMVSNGGIYGNTRILQEDTVNTMLTPLVVTDNEAVGVFWATQTFPNNRVVIGHNGGDPGAYSYIYFDPAKKTGVVLIANGDVDYDDAWYDRHDKLADHLLDYAETLGEFIDNQ